MYILPSGAYVTLYMGDCSHYEIGEIPQETQVKNRKNRKKTSRIYLAVFPKQYIQ